MGQRNPRPWNGLRWARAVMLSLGFLVAHCGDDSNTSNSSDEVGATPTGGEATTPSEVSTPGTTPAPGSGDEPDGPMGTPSSPPLDGTAPAAGAGGAAGGGASGTPGSAGGSGAAGNASTDDGSRGGASGGEGGAATSDGGTATGGSNDGGASTGGSGDAPGTGGAPGGEFTLTSPGWMDMEGCGPDAKTSCAPLPVEITRSGSGTSPELSWSGAPEGTQSFVVVFQDLSNGTAHWVLWNISSSVTLLEANVDQTTATPDTPEGSQQCGKGTDAATSDGYYGPGAPCNAYEFVVYALGIAQFSPTDATDAEAVRMQLEALGPDILGTASLRGRTDQGC